MGDGGSARRPHKKLRAWRESIRLVIEVYRNVRTFPNFERFGLAAQMQRAAVSVPSNIAEGAARHSKKEFLKFIYIAKGSLSELDTQIEIGRDLGFLSDSSSTKLLELIGEIDRLLTGLISSIRRKLTSEE
ncbi:MAG: four helix bundle protein [Acidobacteriota bacterium]